MRLFYQLVIMLFIFSVLGWMMEVALKYRQYHRFINRGFLIGPYCPIYGFGVVLVTVIVGDIIGMKGTYPETFLAGFVICGFLEYMTSLYMEKLFHARWWDYSNKPMNLNGRIWIGNLILFGVASMVIVKIIAPHYFHFIDRFHTWALAWMAWIIVIVMGTDFGISHFLMSIVKKQIDTTSGDNTEEISTKVHALLRNRGLLVRRIYQAYPDFVALPNQIVQDYRSAKREYKAKLGELKHELDQRFDADFDPNRLNQAKADVEAAYKKLMGFHTILHRHF